MFGSWTFGAPYFGDGLPEGTIVIIRVSPDLVLTTFQIQRNVGATFALRTTQSDTFQIRRLLSGVEER